jgi:hypothetical protein
MIGRFRVPRFFIYLRSFQYEFDLVLNHFYAFFILGMAFVFFSGEASNSNGKDGLARPLLISLEMARVTNAPMEYLILDSRDARPV